MNCFLTWMLHIVLMLTLTSCGLYHHSNNEKTMEVKVDITNELILLKDSLLTAGVDSLFVFRKSCENCLKQSVVYDSRKEKKGITYSITAFSTPAYVFWLQKDKYYVKKIDQFEVYPTIERPEWLHFPLYHFWQMHHELLVNEQPVRQITDTVIIQVPYDKPDTIVKIIPVYYYESADNLESSRIPATNRIHIGCYSQHEQFERTINEQQFNPIVTTNDVYLTMRKNNSGDPVVIGNDKDHYQLNRSMKIYEWCKLIESELFDIEMRQLWKSNAGSLRH